MIRLALFAFILTLAASCAVKKPTCTQVIVNTTQIEMVQVNEANSMYVFFISTGNWKGTRVFINRQGEAQKTTTITVSNPDNPIQCLPVSPDAWTWTEAVDESAQQISMQGTANIVCAEKNYCLTFSYSGPLMKTPGTTVPEK